MTSAEPSPEDRGAPDGPGGPDGPRGTLESVSVAALWMAGTVGLVGGWLLRRVGAELLGTAPLVAWTQPALLVLLAAALLVTARQTDRARRGLTPRLEAHQAVNRLALARAAAYVGALVAGGYAGYALSWVGSAAELAGDRIAWSSAAAVAAVLVVVGGLLLERACRVREDDERA